jgi:hypothetical protein
VYEYVVEEKAGDNVPEVGTNELRVRAEFACAPLVISRTYDVVDPSPALTVTVRLFSPVESAFAVDIAPDETTLEATVIVADTSRLIGRIRILATALAT